MVLVWPFALPLISVIRIDLFTKEDRTPHIKRKTTPLISLDPLPEPQLGNNHHPHASFCILARIGGAVTTLGTCLEDAATSERPDKSQTGTYISLD